MLKVAIIIGSTRPNRKGEVVAKWVHEHASKRTDAAFELVDVAAFDLPLLDEPSPASTGKYEKAHTKRWSETIAAFDAFVFVTPEYNRGVNGALKNAIDFLYKEWTNKAAGFVGYGQVGAARSIEQLRLAMGELQVADVRSSVMMLLSTDWENYTVFKPQAKHEKNLASMFDQIVSWGTALKTVRESQSKKA